MLPDIQPDLHTAHMNSKTGKQYLQSTAKHWSSWHKPQEHLPEHIHIPKIQLQSVHTNQDWVLQGDLINIFVNYNGNPGWYVKLPRCTRSACLLGFAVGTILNTGMDHKLLWVRIKMLGALLISKLFVLGCFYLSSLSLFHLYGR